VRALAADRLAASLQGIRVRRVAAIAFASSAMFAALGGILVAPSGTVNLTFGFGVMLTSFSAAILGVGVAKRVNAIRWTIVERMVWAWILTLPVTGGIAWLLVRGARLLGWVG
jgi:ribose/xylose/arabinose/galactoside ABC-type transport system permease subunit